jgi:hypothetical protein
MNIPDRCSSDSDSIWFMPTFIECIELITINGEKKFCVEFCISEQWAKCIALDADGNTILDGDEIKLETIENATIEVTLKD